MASNKYVDELESKVIELIGYQKESLMRELAEVEEINLRKNNAAVQDAWEKYQITLKLARENK